METNTEAVESLTGLPNSSCTVTSSAGLMARPAVALEGGTVNASREAAALETLKKVLLAAVSVPEVAVSRYAPT
ncbi:MAG: hypothetical protein ACK4N5_27110, partial [Myxococcales bacterium]